MNRRTFLKAGGAVTIVAGNVAFLSYIRNRPRGVGQHWGPGLSEGNSVKDEDVCSIAFSLHGNHLAGVTADDRLSIWDAATRKPTSTVPAGQRGRVSTIGFLSQDTWLVTADPEMAFICVRKPGKLQQEMGFELKLNPTAMALSPEVKNGVTPPPAIAAVGLTDDSVWIYGYGLYAGMMTGRFNRFAPLAVLKKHTGRINSLAFHPEEGRLLASASDDETVRIWDSNRWKECTVLKGHQDAVKCVTFSKDGRLLASGAADGTITIWDYRRRAQLQSFRGHRSALSRLAFFNDSSWIASLSADKAMKIWHLKNGPEEALRLPENPGRYPAMDISADGQLLASSWGKDVRFWRISELNKSSSKA
jgi:WD40 repeat protein